MLSIIDTVVLLLFFVCFIVAHRFYLYFKDDIKIIMKKIDILGICAVAASAFALPIVSVGVSAVWVDDFVLSRCGPQDIAFSGIANPGAGETLRVKLDEVFISHTLTGASWSTGLTPVSTGSHTVKGEIVQGDGTVTHSHARNFEVSGCVAPGDTPTNGGGGDGGGDDGNGAGDGGDEGENPAVTSTTKKSRGKQVKGANCDIANSEVPVMVARIFREVFGRDITHSESVYWKARARSDKCSETALIGTMRWHKAHGSAWPRTAGVSHTEGSKAHHSQINALFRLAYGRNPSMSENKYWLSRLSDKPTTAALLGAMQYHKLKNILH